MYFFLRKNGLYAICMIKTMHSGFPKKQLVQKLDTEKRAAHVVAVLEDSISEKLISVGWRGKSDWLKGKKRKNHYISTFLSSECTTNLPEIQTEKKRHNTSHETVQSVFVPRPQLVVYNIMVFQMRGECWQYISITSYGSIALGYRGECSDI